MGLPMYIPVMMGFPANPVRWSPIEKLSNIQMYICKVNKTLCCIGGVISTYLTINALLNLSHNKLNNITGTKL
jgi:DNA polymerase II large subunit